MADRSSHHGIDLGLVARRQRFLLWSILLVVLCNIGLCSMPSVFPASSRPPGVSIALLVVLLGANICAFVGLVNLMAALGRHIFWRIVCIILMFIPLVGLLILLSVNAQANRLFKQMGIRVGLMGVADESVRRRLLGNLCLECGYDLTGNVSGICPECGTPILREIPAVPGQVARARPVASEPSA